MTLINSEPSSLGSRVYIPFTFVTIKSFAFKECATYAAIESEVTSHEHSKGSSFFKNSETIKIGVKPLSEIFSASSIVYANFVEFTLSLTNLDKISIHSIAVL